MAFSSYDAAIDAIGRSRALLDAARPRLMRNRETGKLFRRRNDPSPATRADMRRLSVVMALAALDAYMHRLILERVYTHDDLPKGLARLDIPFSELLGQADATASAARAVPSNPRPRVGVKRLLRDRLLRETYQTYNAVSQALSMAGRPKEWDEIGKRLSPPLGAREIKQRLDTIVHRRNQIVHEGDYVRLEKPQGPRLNRMTQVEARNDINFIAQLINAIHGAPN